MSTLDHVHETRESVASVEETPAHPPRVSTPAYKAAHEYLVDKQDKPCMACGVRNSTLNDLAQNPYHATQIETHHFPIERSLCDACNPDKVHKSFPQVINRETLEAFVDSPANLIVLCDKCHRSPERGIHHLLPQDWFILPFLYDGYEIAATPKDADQVEQADEKIEEAHGFGG